MCGIIVIISKKSKLEKKKCFQALDDLKKRGPDNTLFNFFDNGKIFVGNTVLSITGTQKKNTNLYNNNKNYIAFNGEIYNYKLLQKKLFPKTVFENDTELLINLVSKFGIKKSPYHLNGMYAFAVYNKNNNSINLVTDPQGEKRFFIFENNEVIIISSTIKSIKKYVKTLEVSNSKIVEYFSTRHLLFYKKTIYKNISLSDPGTITTIKNLKMKCTFHFNCLKFINKRKYLQLNKMSEKNLISHFDKLFFDQLSLMIPDRKFGSIVSGGIDSSLVSHYLNKIKKPNILAGIDHVGKDKVIKNIPIFQKHLKRKIHLIKLNSKKYFLLMKKTYQSFSSPFLTHDCVSRYLVSKFFRNKGCKVFFSGDGADELFGGYSLYTKTKWVNGINSSPYSNINTNNKIENEKINVLWKKAFKKYSKFLSKREATIQASLFADYFVQGVSVANIGTDILSGENSIETRNLFIQKNIIFNALNLPLKHKINLNLNSNFKTKTILKKLFVQKFDNNLNKKKQGFSGFPNETFKYLSNDYKNKLNTLKKKLGFNSLNKAKKWKLLNIFFFNLYCLKKS